MSCCPNADSPGIQKGPATLPFNVEYGTPNNPTQSICNNNMCLLPSGPIIPTRPMFPSALPSEFTPSITNVQTNYLNVKKLGCICNLRTSCLQVDDGARNTGSTNVIFKNLPPIESDYRFLVVDALGRVHTQESVVVSKQIKAAAKGRIRRPTFGEYDGEEESPFNIHESQYMPHLQQPYYPPPGAAVPLAENMIAQPFTCPNYGGKNGQCHLHR